MTKINSLKTSFALFKPVKDGFFLKFPTNNYFLVLVNTDAGRLTNKGIFLSCSFYHFDRMRLTLTLEFQRLGCNHAS